MHVTREDIGRLVWKRDNHMRRFVITQITGDEVTLEDLIFGQTFTVTDLRTYELVKPTHGRGNHEAT